MSNIEYSYDEYVRSSAVYCADLFETAERFYAANIEVERTIVVEDEVHVGKVEEIVSHFTSCRDSAKACIESLLHFQAQHEGYPASLVKVDFSEQKETLESIAADVDKILGLFSNLEDRKSLQEQIWSKDDFTRLFISVARGVSAAVVWQCDFAGAANLGA